MSTYRGQQLTRELSEQQKAIIDHCLDGSGDLVVNAGPGSGKTTTAIILAQYLERGVMVAFNKSIADELSSRLPDNFGACTIHSLAFRAVKRRHKRTQVVSGKYAEIAREIIAEGNGWLSYNEARDCFDSIRSAGLDLGVLSSNALVAHIRDKGVDIDWSSYGLPELVDLMKRMAVEGVKRAEKEVDFTDMLWLTSQLNLTVDQFPWVVVDECQDLSPLQLDIVLRAREQYGRMVFVGDPWQAIYGFAGASCESVDEIIETTGARVLPLSICYRCGSRILELVRALNPDILDAPGCQPGEVSKISNEEIPKLLDEGDLVICRRNAPLVAMTFRLLAEGIKAQMRGRDVGRTIVTGIKKIQAKKVPFCRFSDGVTAWMQREIERAGDDGRVIDAIKDKAEVMLIFWDRSNSYKGMYDQIEELFSDERATIWLSSVHRAKGLESDRVFILDYPNIRMQARIAWQLKQERHLEYVALSRAKSTLFLCY